MELIEFHIGHPAARAPGHGDAVTGGAVGIAGIEVDLAGATGRQDREAGAEGFHMATAAVEDIGAQAAVARLAQFGGGDQVHRDVVFQQLDIGVGLRLLQQGIEDRRAGGVGRVNDAAMAVPALPGEVEVVGLGAILAPPAGKGHALIHQPADRIATVADDLTNGVLVAESATGNQGVLHMGIDGIRVIQHRRHATLRPEGRTLR